MNPFCTHCGIELDYFDYYDSYDDGELIICRARGECPRCHKKYEWEDVYALIRYQEVEEVEEW